MVPPLLLRHSRAALQSESEGHDARTILIAFVANVIIAVAKLAAGLVSGSAALLGEAAHSFADSLNEIFLGYSLRRARRPADPEHPLGHGRERFLWAFMAAIASFLIGGCLSIALAIREFIDGRSGDSYTLAWIVLAISFVADGASWLQGTRQARQEASARGKTVWQYLWRTSDPALRAVVVEDSAALIGLGLASAGLFLHQVTGSETPDATAALLIGVLLTLTAVALARSLADFLVGRSLPQAHVQRLHEVLSSHPAIAEVILLRAVYVGAEDAIVTAKVHAAPNVTIDAYAHAADDLDAAMRAAVPEVADVYLDVTSYHIDTLPLDREHGFEPA